MCDDAPVSKYQSVALGGCCGTLATGGRRKGHSCRTSCRVREPTDAPPSWPAEAGTAGGAPERRHPARGKAWTRPAPCPAKGCSPRAKVQTESRQTGCWSENCRRCRCCCCCRDPDYDADRICWRSEHCHRHCWIGTERKKIHLWRRWKRSWTSHRASRRGLGWPQCSHRAERPFPQERGKSGHYGRCAAGTWK